MTQRSPFPESLDIGRKDPVDLPPQAPPTFAVDAARVNIQTIELDVAQINKRIEFGASNFIWALDATSLTATLSMRLNSQQNSPIPFKKGLVIRNLAFSTVYITHDAQPGQSITFFIVRQGEGNLLVENAVLEASQVTETKPTILNTIVDVSAPTATTTQVLAANANRREAIIQNWDASHVVIGDSNVAQTRGHRLALGASIILTVTEAISVRNDSGGVARITVLEIED